MYVLTIYKIYKIQQRGFYKMSGLQIFWRLFYKILGVDLELWQHIIFGPKRIHFCWTRILKKVPRSRSDLHSRVLSEKNFNITMIYPFYCAKIIKRNLSVDSELWRCIICRLKIIIYLKQEFLRKIIYI